MAESTRDIIRRATIVTTGESDLDNNCNSSNNCAKKAFVSENQAAQILLKVKSLMSETHRKWYYGRLFALGEHKFLLCAELSARGREPQKLFSYWLTHPEKIDMARFAK